MHFSDRGRFFFDHNNNINSQSKLKLNSYSYKQFLFHRRIYTEIYKNDWHYNCLLVKKKNNNQDLHIQAVFPSSTFNDHPTFHLVQIHVE